MSRSTVRGASLVELTVVLPALLSAVMALWQTALVFHAKSHLNYAAFEAARAGSVQHAKVAGILDGLSRGLVGYYGGGLTTEELVQRRVDVAEDLARSARIEILSPLVESFDDYASPQVSQRLGTNARALPQLGLSFLQCPHDRPDCNADPARNRSGQTLSDANLLKLRVTYGIPQDKQLPLAGRMFRLALQAVGGGDAFRQQLLQDGRIPVVTHVTVRMQSEPIENAAMQSRTGAAGNGPPNDAGTPGAGTGGGGGSGSSGGGDSQVGDPNPPPCTTTNSPLTETVSADVLFPFDSAVLTPEGRVELDRLIEEAGDRDFDSLEVIGHTDTLGTANHNAKLSQQRADAVRDYLRANGFPSKPITTEGLGSTELVVPLSSCPSSGQAQIDCLAPNRRVTFVWRKG